MKLRFTGRSLLSLVCSFLADVSVHRSLRWDYGSQLSRGQCLFADYREFQVWVSLSSSYVKGWAWSLHLLSGAFLKLISLEDELGVSDLCCHRYLSYLQSFLMFCFVLFYLFIYF